MGLSYFSIILKDDNTLWGCGGNGSGELGLGDTTNRTTFTQITTNTDDVKEIYCGGGHTFVLKNDGTLWGCGYNRDYGQLGLGDNTDRNTFTQIIDNNIDNIKSVYCGGDHTLILKNDGTLWGCGRNEYGQLGLGDTTNRTAFIQIATNTDDIKSVYCGGYHTFILKNDGTLWGCGRNYEGQLGLGDTTDRTTFTQITTNADDIKSVYCGGYHTFILKNDDTLWGCGYNGHGNLGSGDTTNKNTFTQITTNANDIKEICCGYNHTFILKNDGTLWGCGLNAHGQLGLGDTTHRYAFTQVTTNTNNIKEIYCGDCYTLILKNDGTLWGCGYNGYGNLGSGDTTNRTTFTQVTTNTDDVKSLPNQYNAATIKVYDLNAGLVETLDTNNFRNIPVNKFEKIKILYTNPTDTLIAGLISFDNKTTWKMFTGTSWTTISDITPNNILLNGMSMEKINNLTKEILVQGGFTGNINFKIALKTNDDTKTPSITKIYIQYKE
ncbi:MAG: hypothetical protein SOZ53_03325 [Candidatus Onthovivens sp.]|nr:hypothetical protein [Candidatus Onthovivens sp.]